MHVSKLSAIGTPTSTSPAPPLSGWSLMSPDVVLFVMGEKWIPSYSPLPSHCSPLEPSRLTLAPGPIVPWSTVVQYCSSQPVLLRLAAHFRPNGQISCPTELMHNAPHNSYLQAVSVRCALLPLLRPQCISCPPRRSIRPRCGGGYGCRLLPTLSHRARLINVARIITTITRHRVSIVWHQHHAASHGNVFGGSNHCESNAFGQRVTV